MGYKGDWYLPLDILCSQPMVEATFFVTMLSRILSHLSTGKVSPNELLFTAHYEQEAAPSRNRRFPEEGKYVFLQQAKVAVTMDSLYALFIVIIDIRKKVNSTAEEFTFLKQNLDELRTVISEFREKIENGDFCYGRESFEAEFQLVWEDLTEEWFIKNWIFFLFWIILCSKVSNKLADSEAVQT